MTSQPAPAQLCDDSSAAYRRDFRAGADFVSIVSDQLPIGHARLEHAAALEHPPDRTAFAQARETGVELADQRLRIRRGARHGEVPGGRQGHLEAPDRQDAARAVGSAASRDPARSRSCRG